jgi:hypothetical protein
MNFRLLTFILLALLLMTIPLLVHSHPKTVVMRVIRPYEGNPEHEVWLEPMQPTRFTFRVEDGEMPEAGALRCEQETVIQYSSDRHWKYPTLVLSCEGGRTLTLTGISF